MCVIFGDDSLYLERVILPANGIHVQVLADRHGNMVHLGEREGSISATTRSWWPNGALGLTQALRARLHDTALQIARLVNCNNAVTVGSLDGEGRFYFCEIKGRITVEHPYTTDGQRVTWCVRRSADRGRRRLSIAQEDVRLVGAGIPCAGSTPRPLEQLSAQPWPVAVFSPAGRPAGGHLRLRRCYVPVRHHPYAGQGDRLGRGPRGGCAAHVALPAGLRHHRGAQQPALFQRIMQDPDFLAGSYTTEFLRRPMLYTTPDAPDEVLREPGSGHRPCLCPAHPGPSAGDAATVPAGLASLQPPVTQLTPRVE